MTAAVKVEFDSRPVLNGQGRVRPVTQGLVHNVINALASFQDLRVSDTATQPVWLGQAPAEREYIAVKNGLLDVEAALAGRPHVLHPHTPEWFTPACLPYAYESTTSCLRWTEFLNWMFKQNTGLIQLVQEWFGYCLVLDSSQQRFVIAVGEGANGKKVLLDTLKNLVGQDNCSSVALEDFAGRFDLSMTIGRLVNICSEVGDVVRLPEGKLKAFVAGDLMTFDRKHRKPLQVNPTARLVFATNQLPKFADRSEGMWRRLIVLPCNATIALQDQDPELAHKMRDELPGILNWALTGLRRLRTRGFFDIPEACHRAREEHRLTSSPELQFFHEECEPQPDAEIRCDELYRSYLEWCGWENHTAMDARQFGKALKKRFPRVGRGRRRVDGKPIWVYTGVRLGGVPMIL